MKLKIVLCFLFIVLSANVSAQDNLILYSTSNGMPSNTVYDCVQDAKGYMWFATDAGVARFDGSRFEHYTTRDGLSDNEVYHVNVDKDGTVWAFTIGNPMQYFEDGRFLSCDSLPFDRINFDLGLYTLKDNFGNLVISIPGTVYKFNKYTVEKVVNVGEDRKLIHYNIKKNHQRIELIGQDFFINVQDGRIEKKIKSPFNNVFARLLICYWEKDTIIGYTADTVYIAVKKNSDKFEVINNLKIEGNINDVVVICGVLYVSTMTKGLRFFDMKLNEICCHIDGMDYDRFVRVHKVRSDRDNNIWVLTNLGAVFIPHHFVTNKSENNAAELNTNIINIEYFKKYNIAIADDSKGNIYVVDTKTNQLTKRFTLPKLSSAMCRGMDIQNNILYMAKENYIVEVNLKNGKINYHHVKLGSIKSIQVIGNIGYIATNGDTYAYNLVTGEHVLIFRGRATQALIGTRHILIGNYKGLCLIDSMGRVVRFYKQTGRVMRIIQGQAGVIWIVSANKGVFYFNKEAQLMPIVSDISVVKKSTVDYKGDLWVCTNKGATHIQYNNGNIKTETYFNWHFFERGIVENVVATESRIIYSTQGELCVADKLRYNKKKFSLFSDYVVYNQKKQPAVDKIVIPPLQKNIAVYFSCVAYGMVRENVGYQYRFSGSDGDWLKTKEEVVLFDKLSPGNYLLELRAVLGDSNVVSDTVKIALVMQPAYWQTTWFKVFLGLIAVLVFVFMLDRRRAALEKKYDKKRQFALLELMQIKSQLNPHFIFNTLNSIQNYINENDKYSANIYLSSFAKLMRKTLQLSKKQDILLAEEVEFLENYIRLEQIRFQHKFSYEIKIAPDIDRDTLTIPSMLLQPFVENAILHGLADPDLKNAKLTLWFTKIGEVFVCKIEDNGIGRSKAALKQPHHKSFSTDLIDTTLSLMKAYDLYDIDCEVIDKADKLGGHDNGTLVVLAIKKRRI